MGGIIDSCYETLFIIRSNIGNIQMLVIVTLILIITTILLCKGYQPEDQKETQTYSKTHTMIPASQYNSYVRQNTLRELEKLKKSPEFINYQKNKKNRPTSILSEDDDDQIIFSDEEGYTGRR